MLNLWIQFYYWISSAFLAECVWKVLEAYAPLGAEALNGTCSQRPVDLVVEKHCACEHDRHMRKFSCTHSWSVPLSCYFRTPSHIVSLSAAAVSSHRHLSSVTVTVVFGDQVTWVTAQGGFGGQVALRMLYLMDVLWTYGLMMHIRRCFRWMANASLPLIRQSDRLE